MNEQRKYNITNFHQVWANTHSVPQCNQPHIKCFILWQASNVWGFCAFQRELIESSVLCTVIAVKKRNKDRVIPCTDGFGDTQSPPSHGIDPEQAAQILCLLSLSFPYSVMDVCQQNFKDSQEATGLAARRLYLSTYQCIFDFDLKRSLIRRILQFSSTN